jgi:cytoskeletal protein RodZ
MDRREIQHEKEDMPEGREFDHPWRVGAFLRAQREAKGYNYKQIFEITRLTPTTLEALEQEHWEALPSHVLVKGFIRAYARALDLEEVEVIELYERSVPATTRLPEPLIEPVRNRIRIPMVLAGMIFIFLCVAVGLLLLRQEPSTDSAGVALTTPEIAFNTEPKAVDDKAALPGKTGVETPVEKKMSSPDDIFDAPKTTALDAEITNGPDDFEQRQLEAKTPKKPALQNAAPDVVTQERATPTDTPSDVLLETGGAIDAFTLRAFVKEETWLKIYVDDENPREYIFRPGSQPQWGAQEGFEMVIGNAGGIEFDFNGQRIADFGRSGQVVRLRFPENYQRRSTTN